MIGNGHAGFGRAASEKDPKGTSPTSYLGALPSRGDRANANARVGTRRDARMARALWQPALVNRLVPHARTQAWRRSAQTTQGRRLAAAVHGHRPVRHLGGGPGRRVPLIAEGALHQLAARRAAREHQVRGEPPACFLHGGQPRLRPCERSRAQVHACRLGGDRDLIAGRGIAAALALRER